MKIGVIGASASGIYCALLLAKRHPDFQIDVFDHCDKPGRKLLATGNGHCNLFNENFSGQYFNNPLFVDHLLARYPKEVLLKELEDLGVCLLKKDDLYYPLSYSAAAYLRFLVSKAEKAGIRFRLGERVLGVEAGAIRTSSARIQYDFVVFAFGGLSQSNLGSDGSCFEFLRTKGYKIEQFRPSLCPLKSLDVPKSLAGIRHKAKISVMAGEEIVYEEKGEILFKADGLSGIAIMNASALEISRPIIIVDLFPDMREDKLKDEFMKAYKGNKSDFLSSLFEKPLADFIAKRSQILDKKEFNEEDFARLAMVSKNLRFEVSGRYGFDASQVTRGGISVEAVDENLHSVIEEGVAFIGECLDIDGRCGGFNLGWALLSALVVAESL